MRAAAQRALLLWATHSTCSFCDEMSQNFLFPGRLCQRSRGVTSGIHRSSGSSGSRPRSTAMAQLWYSYARNRFGPLSPSVCHVFASRSFQITASLSSNQPTIHITIRSVPEEQRTTLASHSTRDMSSRQLRRLGKDDLEATLLKITSKSPSPNADESPNTKSVPASSNLFMLMNEGEDEEDEEDEEEAPEAAASDSEPVATPVKQNTLEIKSRSQKKKSKKKNRNQSKKGTKQSQAGNSNPDDSEPKDDDEEFDKIIQQFQKSHVKAFRHADSDDEGFTTADEEVSDAEGTENSWAKLFDLRQDSGFTKFKYFKQLNELFADFDFKNLVPDNEFKLLFDDLSPETLQDIDSVTSTHVSPEVMKQIDRMKRLVKNWSGKDKRSVPNGGTVRKLQFTKIRDDWLPTIRGELSLKRLGNEELVKWLRWERPLDWDAVIKSDVEHKWTKHFNYYKFEPLNDANSKKALTEFYLSAVLSPDHEALISLISSHFPYHVPGLLQVALICVRQGDKSNSNGLVERALFVFDRCLKNGIEFNAKDFQLPYIYFYNRQFYLALMRYIQIVSQRGAISTAAQLCKTLLSLSPLEDPLGVRYFIDHYLATNNEYLYLIKLVKSPLSNLYRQWFTLGIGLTGVYAYLQLDCADDARILLERVWISYPHSLCKVFTDFLLGDISKLPKDIAKPSTSVLIETKASLYYKNECCMERSQVQRIPT